MGKAKTASNEEWSAYYEAADRLRVVVGDPYKRYADRKIVRERVLLFASCLFMSVMAAAFIALAGV